MAFVATNANTRLAAPSAMILAGLPLARFGVVFAWIAVIIYAASNSIVTQLVEIGATNPVQGGRNAISYQNLLLLGSLLSVVPLALLFRHDLTRANVSTLDARDWRVLTLSAFLSSALTPGLFFYALAHTTVTNVVLISRIEPPLFLLAAWLLLHDRFSSRAMIAGLVALAGAIVMIGMGDGGGLSAIGKGEWAAVAATLSYIASTLVARKGLRDVPMGIFAVYRTIVGAAFYVLLAMMVYGPDTFRDLFAPVLWNWIWVYAGVVLVLGQIAWNLALKYASAGDLALATSFSPLAAILIAMILLGENPGPGLLPGAALILAAIVIGRGVFTRTTELPADPQPIQSKAMAPSVPGQPCIGCDCQGPALMSHPIKQPNPGAHGKTVSPKTAAPPGRREEPERLHRTRRPSVQPS